MKIRLLLIGKTKPASLEFLLQDYQKKLRNFCSLDFVFIKECKLHYPPEKLLEEEAKRIKKHLQNNYLIVLDEKGEQFESSISLAKTFEKRVLNSCVSVDILIGGAWGLAPIIKNSAQWRLSLSGLTTTHQLARVFFLEQLYRSFTLCKGIEYHK